MRILDYIRNIFSTQQREAKIVTPLPIGDTSSPRLGNLLISSPGAVDPMAVATVYCCVKLLCDSVANLPILVLKRKDGIFVPDNGAYGSRLWHLLNVQPSPGVNAFDFRRRLVQNVLCRGNAYIVPVYDTIAMEIERLVLCSCGSVAHDTTNDIYTVTDADNDLYGTFDESEIVHVKGLTGYNPKVGVSVLESARQAMGIAGTGDRETLDRFSNGGNVRGIVSNGDVVRGYNEYSDNELQRTATDLDSRFRAGERIVSLPGQVGWSQLTMTSADMEFLASRKFTVREICRFFGVHPSFVFDDTSNNYKSAEQANVAFLSHTLAPLLRSIETELLCKLIDPRHCADRRIEFDKRGLYACDLEGMARYRLNLLQMGTTVNEIRRMDNLPPVEGGDAVLVSANLRNINEPAAGSPAPAKPEKEKAQDNDTEDPEESEEPDDNKEHPLIDEK